MPAAPSALIRTMVVRVSLDDVIIYANDALADYLQTPKNSLIGASLDDISRLCNGEISSCFARPSSGRTSNRLAKDETGRVFEAQLFVSGALWILFSTKSDLPTRRRATCANRAERHRSPSARTNFAPSVIRSGAILVSRIRGFRDWGNLPAGLTRWR